MPSDLYKVKVNVPIDRVWKFVSQMDNWAPLVPGYIEHEILSETESTWKFRSDIGIMKKKVHLKVDITSWQEPTKVTFNLKGINEKFSGSGFFEAEVIDNENTFMTGSLDISADGAMAKMVNSILKTNVPDMTKELTVSVAEKVEEVAGHRTKI